ISQSSPHPVAYCPAKELTIAAALQVSPVCRPLNDRCLHVRHFEVILEVDCQRMKHVFTGWGGSTKSWWGRPIVDFT
ncbi:MAG: hypothetical protein WBQ59_21560, partial [Candidatus Acidiferrum sp.]